MRFKETSQPYRALNEGPVTATVLEPPKPFDHPAARQPSGDQPGLANSLAFARFTSHAESMNGAPQHSASPARLFFPSVRILLFVLFMLVLLPTARGIGQPRIVEYAPEEGGLALFSGGAAAPLVVDEQDWPGVLRAATSFQADVARVTGVEPKLLRGDPVSGADVVVIGTLGKSGLIERLVREGKINPAPIAGQWEASLVQVVERPLPGIERALVVAGSDKRGTIYGIYNLSEQIGVSPWYWWADVPITRHDQLFVSAGCHVQGPPTVKYRGIFLNDEAPALDGWAKEKFGGFNHGFYTNVFELLLRLRANYLWPAMWNNSFATDDPLNAPLADEFGIVIGTSHHEPMMRAWKEWSRAGNGPGSWDYSKNEGKLSAFWAEGLRRTRNYEKIITLGMRGDGDEAMNEQQNVALLERIVSDQRKMIREWVDPNLERVPQSWALYKEVQGYYERGMRVPDDVTLLWCDDNWGNLRRLPTPEERQRRGGAGIYYHFDYVGGPRNYKWLNTVPIPRIWEQMNLAAGYGADRLWIVNVGDLKPMEIPIEFFLTFAWDVQRWTQNDLGRYLRLWAIREFGPDYAGDIADLVAKYTKYNGRRKPELLAPGTFSLVNYGEADRVVAEWRALAERADMISKRLPPEAQDAFFELVMHPIEACRIVNELYITAARNRLYAEQHRASANDLAAQTRGLFKADAALTERFHHQLAGGKWNHMMSQTHIGYTGWQQPPVNIMPAVREIEVPAAASLGVALEGSTRAWPGGLEPAVLPELSFFGEPRRYLEVFNQGAAPLKFRASVNALWLVLSSYGGTIAKDERLWVGVDWGRAPRGRAAGAITISAAGSEPVTVRVPVFNPPASVRNTLRGFVEADGCIVIGAAHYSTRRDLPGARWEELPDYGLYDSAMTVFPVTAAAGNPPLNSACLEYELSLVTTGRVEVALLLSPSLNYDPGRGVRIGVSFDDALPQILTVVPKGYTAGDGNRDWEESVKNSLRRVLSTQVLSEAGRHTLKVWMVDPGVVLERLIVNTGGLRPSYLGPSERIRIAIASEPVGN